MFGRAEKPADRYEWTASNSAPLGCPVWLLGGNFSFPGGDGGLYIPSATLHSGWGIEVSAHLAGDDLKPVPDRMNVLYFSYLEDRFYQGTFPLARDTIAQLFRTGYRSFRDPSGHATYDALVAGVAPGGAVAVWASGGERQVQVFFGRAEAADLDWHQTLRMPASVNRQTFVARDLAEAGRTDPLVAVMRKHPPAFDRWAGFQPRYRWRQTFEGVGAPARPERVQYVNGERDFTVRPLEPGAADATLAAPRTLGFDDSRTGRTYDLTFDEDEVTAAFARVAAAGRPFELVLAAPAAGAGAKLHVTVRSPTEEVPLRNVKVAVYGPA